MGSFDLETFAKVQGQTGTGVFQAFGMAHGLPSCMLSLGQAAMGMLPSSVLAAMSGKIEEAKAAANNKMKEVFAKLMRATGIKAFITETGTIQFGGIGWNDIDNFGLQGLNDLGGALGALQYAASYGAQIYQNVTGIIDQVDNVIDCLDKYKQVESYQSGNSANQKEALSTEDQEALMNETYAADKAKLQRSLDFVNEADAQIQAINEILASRALDPSLEPCFLDSSELDPFLDGTTFTRCPAVDPGLAQEDIFRLSYGPPISEAGHYVLTSDGLYYDSQSGGLDPVYLAISGIVPVGEAWTYDYDPNLGGKGQAISMRSLNKYTDNIFDLNLIDDSLALQQYYDADHFLSTLIQQRDKHVFDLSGDLQSYISEFGTDSSITRNQRQLIISDIALHNSKLNRRKKQIEVSIKAPQIYGDGSEPAFSPGNVPINDFSYLEKFNLGVDIEKQKALIFEQAEVGGIVLPIQPKFVSAAARPETMSVEHLYVPVMGKGSILYAPSGSMSGTVLSLTDEIATDGLFAIYNFLETNLELPSSINFPTTNCATQDMYNNGQLVGPSKKEVFFSGLGIPYLEGIVENKSTDTAAASALGSYFKLPATSEFNDLTYSPSGFTMECWVHVPSIMDGEIGWLSSTASSLTKALISCDNVGVKEGASALDHTGAPSNLDALANDRGDSFVRGMVCGFTRDRRITHTGQGYSNANYNNDPVSSLSFFIAPTQARDSSSASFINDIECQNTTAFYNMKSDLADTAFGNVSSQFVLIDITVDPAQNEMRFYADGTLVTTSSISASFGTTPTQTINLPSFKKNNSFEYSSTTVDGPTTLKTGPALNAFYTPWIVGGGYTDGMYLHGNFLGGDRGGITSGLRGHVGSLKFYSQPLDREQVKTNYKAQKGFFKNIRM